MEYAASMRATFRRYHCWLSLAVGFACLLVGREMGPAVAFALFVVGCGLMFDGVTILWAGASRAGGMSDHRQ
jgi:hypothetical protein